MHAASCGHSLVSIEFNQFLAFYVFHTFSIIFIRYNTPKTFSSFGRVVSVNKQTSQTSRASHRRAGTGYGAAAARGTGPIVFCPTISNYKRSNCFFLLLVWTFCMARLRRTEVSRRFFLVRSLLSETAACNQGSSHDFLWGWSPEKAPNQAWGSGVSYQS